MSERIREVGPPRGLSRSLYRMPILLYRAGLGWLLGDRFLLLTHTGRVSGLPRQAVLEVIKHDRTKNSYYVVSAFGDKSDWLRNIRRSPEVDITVRRHRIRAVAQPIEAARAEEVILDYARRYPIAARLLLRLVGYIVDGSEDGYRMLARKLIVVCISPRDKNDYMDHDQL